MRSDRGDAVLVALSAARWNGKREDAGSRHAHHRPGGAGFAQDEGYAAELYRIETHQYVTLDQFLTTRLDRRNALEREEPPDVTIVIWEPVLDHPIGPPAVMTSQMKYLLELSELPNVHMQIRRGNSSGLGASINLAMTSTIEVLTVDGFWS